MEGLEQSEAWIPEPFEGRLALLWRELGECLCRSSIVMSSSSKDFGFAASDECVGNVISMPVGDSTMMVFIFGLFLLLGALALLVILFSSLCKGARARVYFILPIYHLLVLYTAVISLLVGLQSTFGVVPFSVGLKAIKLTCYLILSVSLTVFFLHNGIGAKALRNSFMVGSFVAIVAGVSIVVSYVSASYSTYLWILSSISLMLAINFAAVVFAPATWFYRRPAAIPLAVVSCVIFATIFCITVVIIAHGDDNTYCALEVTFDIYDVLQPFLVLRAVYQDSLFWQGLYKDGRKTSTLNAPLLGIWDAGRETAARIVDTLDMLEMKVVPIVPFDLLEMDVSKFFSGGSARVYRGRLQGEAGDVAIKILFCIELTPERVVDFCNEATLLNSLQHPNIVRCLGVAVMPPAISLVTEYCHFGSLFDFLHSFNLRDSLQSRVVGNSQAFSLGRSRLNTADSVGLKKTSDEGIVLGRVDGGGDVEAPLSSEDLVLVPGRASASLMHGADAADPVTICIDEVVDRQSANYDYLKEIAKVASEYITRTHSESTSHSKRSATELDRSNHGLDTPLGRRVAGRPSGAHMQSAAEVLQSQKMGFGLGPNDQESVLNPRILKHHSEKRSSDSIAYSFGSSLSGPSIFLSGGRDSNRLNFGRFIPLALRLKFCRDCCAGLSFLHSKGFMHCDIKSLNFLVSKELVVKLSDLGEARSLLGNNDAGTMPSTINWSSPEILSRSTEISDSADIWSLAFVISEILSGEIPFDDADIKAMSLGALLENLLAGLRPRVGEVVAESCPWLLELLEGAWAYEPQDRCSSREMLEVFQEKLLGAERERT